MPPPAPAGPVAATGIPGLDDILTGGFTRDRVYLIEGDPGAGKTTLALRFLVTGAAAGEPVLYVTLSETVAEVEAVVASHGLSLAGVELLELAADEAELLPDNQAAMFQPGELELGETTQRILTAVERLKPRRVVLDSLSELRLLAQNPLRYRRQVLALKRFFAGRGCTVLLLDDRTADGHDQQVHSIAHGVVELEQLAPAYGAERRRLRVIKYRGVRYRGGYHDFTIETGGLVVYPRLVAADHKGTPPAALLPSGVPALDALCGGGLERGSSVLLLGPAGCGKSTTAAQYARAAAGRGERAALFAFDESTDTLLTRTTGLGIDLRGDLAAGLLQLQQVDPAELSPGQFGAAVRRAVQPADGSAGATVVVIDSLNGYLNAMPDERQLTAQLHELLTYLGQRGVVTFLVIAQHGVLGDRMYSPVDTSYLADAVFLFRYFEAAGEVRQALSVVKKRRGRHERTIREFSLGAGGVRIGAPLREFRGVLSGTPEYTGSAGPLMASPAGG